MLMFMARLQRQDLTLEEAALDLGASRARAFRRITLYTADTASQAILLLLESLESIMRVFFPQVDAIRVVFTYSYPGLRWRLVVTPGSDG